jgi:hypothetical protein
MHRSDCDDANLIDNLAQHEIQVQQHQNGNETPGIRHITQAEIPIGIDHDQHISLVAALLSLLHQETGPPRRSNNAANIKRLA